MRRVPVDLDLEQVAVVRGSEQHRLLLQAHASLAVIQYALDHVAGLLGLVAYGDELRALAGSPIRP